jgi:hypothetical protein
MSQNCKNRFFLLYFLNDIRIRIRMAQKHVDSDPDSDPEHCWKQFNVPLVMVSF